MNPLLILDRRMTRLFFPSGNTSVDFPLVAKACVGVWVNLTRAQVRLSISSG